MMAVPAFLHIPHRAVALLLPFLVLAVHLLLMYGTLPSDLFMAMTGLMVAYMLPPAGKETVIPIGIAIGIPWWYMALSVTMIDVETGLFMALNFDLAYKIPFLGKILVGVTDKTREFIEYHRWIATLYFFGIILMVAVPFLGSGGIRGSIAGKLLGMETWPVFAAIVTGALIGCFAIALTSEALIVQICANGILPADIAGFVCNRTFP
jgi:uncharacterized membrane protein